VNELARLTVALLHSIDFVLISWFVHGRVVLATESKDEKMNFLIIDSCFFYCSTNAKLDPSQRMTINQCKFEDEMGQHQN